MTLGIPGFDNNRKLLKRSLELIENSRGLLEVIIPQQEMLEVSQEEGLRVRGEEGDDEDLDRGLDIGNVLAGPELAGGRRGG